MSILFSIKTLTAEHTWVLHELLHPLPYREGKKQHSLLNEEGTIVSVRKKVHFHHLDRHNPINVLPIDYLSTTYRLPINYLSTTY